MQVLSACLNAFQRMRYLPTTEFTDMALQQLLSGSLGDAGVEVECLKMIHRLGRRPQTQDLILLEHKVRAATYSSALHVLMLVPVLAFVLVLVRHTSCSSTASAGMQCPQHDSRLKLGCPGGGVAQPPVCGALDEPCERPGWLEPPLGRCISGQPGRLLLQAHCGLSAAGEAQLRRMQLSCRLTS